MSRDYWPLGSHNHRDPNLSLRCRLLNVNGKLTFEKGKEISSLKTNEQTDILRYRGSLQNKTDLKRVDLSEKGDMKLKDCTAAIYAARVGGGGEVQRVENKEMNLSKESQNIS